MCALVIRDEVSPQDLRRWAGQERDGGVAARLIAIANAMEGMDGASAASAIRGIPPLTALTQISVDHLLRQAACQHESKVPIMVSRDGFAATL
jgi:hypothetical protein